MNRDQTIKDSVKQGWVESMPESIRPFLRLSRYDRPVGFWLLALPGWIGLAFAALTHGFSGDDLKYAVLIAVGAIAMRGAGCTYNDIVDRDLDASVERTALRPLPAGTVSLKAAWIWIAVQCAVGAIVLAFFPRIAQIIAVSSLALVAAYPFMKRITFWPQAWLGLTFNWAVLVAYTAKTGEITPSLLLLYAGLVFWTIGYDTIYACQDKEDDALIGIKSTARLFGDRVKLGVGICYINCIALIIFAKTHAAQTGGLINREIKTVFDCGIVEYENELIPLSETAKFDPITLVLLLPFAVHLAWQVWRLNAANPDRSLKLFKSNRVAAILLIAALVVTSGLTSSVTAHMYDGPCQQGIDPNP